ncbi:hypothetical protein ACIQVK_16125 [Streptomyces sp. NPDC090493]|uniref:hypothetical protein n=1 Tax=Streptomyces sp. NPDC090493 TaxID=3365964 RepID=UPI00380C97A6
MTRYRPAVAVALGLLATACTASPEAAVPRTVLAAAPAPTKEVTQLVLPFDRYQLSVNDIYLIESAKDILTRACMKKRGYGYEAITHRKQYQDLRNRRRYGVIEIPVARKMGYRTNARLLGSTDVTAQKMDRDARMSPAARKAASDPTDGCYKLAGDRLARGNEENEDLVNKLNVDSLDEALKSPRVAPAVRAWGRCMKQRGHSYKDFYAASEDPRWARTEKLSGAERETAVADVTCKEQAGLVTLLSETERDIEERDIRGNKAYFSRLAAARSRHLAAARAVLRGAGD